MNEKHHRIYEDIPKLIEACCDLLISQRERFHLTDEMIYNIEQTKNGKKYIIKVEVKDK